MPRAKRSSDDITNAIDATNATTVPRAKKKKKVQNDEQRKIILVKKDWTSEGKSVDDMLDARVHVGQLLGGLVALIMDEEPKDVTAAIRATFSDEKIMLRAATYLDHNLRLLAG